MTKHRASALLVSFFMMSLLLVVVLGMNFLVLEDSRTVQTVVAGSQAEYAAEGLNEWGLYQVTESLPGYEPSASQTLSSGAQVSLATVAREDTMPCSIQGDDWRSLGLNESIQLPLFAQIDSEGNVEDLDDFFVEFYITRPSGAAVQINGDVLRWKILGFTQDGTTSTEAISEFIGLDLGNFGFTADNPSVFGSAVSSSSVPTEYTHATYVRTDPYLTFFDQYPIGDFLGEHDYNYLVLTNVIPSLGEGYDIHFRLNVEGSQPVCEYVRLDSVAEVEFGDAKQALQTVIREGENLPAFDFVLYHTDN